MAHGALVADHRTRRTYTSAMANRLIAYGIHQEVKARYRRIG